MKNITVGESALRSVVGEKKKIPYHECKTAYEAQVLAEKINIHGAYNCAIDKTLSTPLPPVEECVMIDVEKLGDLLLSPKLMGLYPRELAEKLANSNSILKWRKEKP